VGQVAVLLGWTKDVVRASCERGELAHTRDHLNTYRIPCSALVAAAGWVRNKQPHGPRGSAHSGTRPDPTPQFGPKKS